MGERSHLHQRLLHGGPVGHSPSTLQDEVRVYVPFGLAIFCQGFPLVQLLRAPRRPGSHEQKFSYQQTNMFRKGRGQSFISIPQKEPLALRDEWTPMGLVRCKMHLPSRGKCSPEDRDPPTTQPRREQRTQPVQRRGSFTGSPTDTFNTQDFIHRLLFVLFSMEP